MAHRVVLSPEAEQDARSAFLWYLGRSPAAAERFEDELKRALESLGEEPEIGPMLDDGVRRLLLPHFPYGVLYAIEGNDAVVLAVMHLRRSPEVWRKRRA